MAQITGRIGTTLALGFGSGFVVCAAEPQAPGTARAAREEATSEVGVTVSMTGSVADESRGTGFDASGYTGLSGVDVCVEGDTNVSRATTDADGKYYIIGSLRARPTYSRT